MPVKIAENAEAIGSGIRRQHQNALGVGNGSLVTKRLIERK